MQEQNKIGRAGLIYDGSQHYLDHLGPFCALMGWPLIACEEAVAERARRYYPDLEVKEIAYWDLELPRVIVACDPTALLLAAFGPRWHAVKKTLWLPHGNSDKGGKTPFSGAFCGDEIALVYGQKMAEQMKESGVSSPLIRIGDFRYFYYEKHRAFYSTLQKKELPSSKRKMVLYAPTWNDWEGNGSFWSAFPHLAAQLPPSHHLFVKLHPNTLRQSEIELEKLLGAPRENISFLLDFPPIHPLLEICAAYIGDMSSIGYDFLRWNRPMFFFTPTPPQSHFLFRCGTEVSPDALFPLIEKKDFTSLRKEAYEYTFDSIASWASIANTIESCVE